MEELFLRGVLPTDEMHVIDEEEIGLAIALPEVVHRPLPMEVMTSLVNCSVVM